MSTGAYAMMAAMVSRILVMPSGMLMQTLLVDRLAACALALVAYQISRKNLLVAVAVGVGAMMAIVSFR